MQEPLLFTINVYICAYGIAKLTGKLFAYYNTDAGGDRVCGNYHVFHP